MDNIAHTVMGVFKAFGAGKSHKVRLTKIGCAEGCPEKVPVGQVVEGTLSSEVNVNLSVATIVEGDPGCERNEKGATYPLWCTSIIQKILTEDTFQTKNSIYKLEIING